MKCDLCDSDAVGAAWSPEEGWFNVCWEHLTEGTLRDYDAEVTR